MFHNSGFNSSSFTTSTADAGLMSLGATTDADLSNRRRINESIIVVVVVLVGVVVILLLLLLLLLVEKKIRVGTMVGDP
jgi:hypothetical protein